MVLTNDHRGIREIGVEYHIIELNSSSVPSKVYEWLESSFGKPSERWHVRQGNIYFAKTKDHTMFMLRWGWE